MWVGRRGAAPISKRVALMAQDESNPDAGTTAEPKPDPFEGVPVGCGTPRVWWPFYLGLIGFGVWVTFLLILMYVRLTTSAV